MSYLDEPLGIPAEELPSVLRHSVRDTLRTRGCPEARLDEVVELGLLYGWRLFKRGRRRVLTRRLYADVVEMAVSLVMDDMNLVS